MRNDIGTAPGTIRIERIREDYAFRPGGAMSERGSAAKALQARAQIAESLRTRRRYSM
jgi:hypothetical protein